MSKPLTDAHRIALLIFPDFHLLDAAGPLAVFDEAGPYSLRIVAEQAGLVHSSAGVAWQAQSLPRLDSFDTLMVVGGRGVDAACQRPALLRLLQRAADAGKRIASVCSGSLLLAAAGLLEGRRASTHWSRIEQFQRQHPQVKLEAERLHVRDGLIWSSAGVSAGIDLALAMLSHDHDAELARRVAQELVVYYQRPGGQSQFSTLAALQGERFAALLDRMRRSLREPLSVEQLADWACMSPRHFSRAFSAETGTTPAKAVERLRVEAARTALASGRVHSLQQLARDCGFGDSERLRRAIRRVLGVAPAQLRLLGEAAAEQPPLSGAAAG